MEQIYITWAQGTTSYKIGIAKEPEERRDGLQIGSPDNLVVIYTEPVQDAKQVETYLHKRWAKFHRRGEWFDFPNIEPVIASLKLRYHGHTAEYMPEFDLFEEIPTGITKLGYLTKLDTAAKADALLMLVHDLYQRLGRQAAQIERLTSQSPMDRHAIGLAWWQETPPWWYEEIQEW